MRLIGLMLVALKVFGIIFSVVVFLRTARHCTMEVLRWPLVAQSSVRVHPGLVGEPAGTAGHLMNAGHVHHFYLVM